MHVCLFRHLGVVVGAGSPNRTGDLLLTKQLLYLMSYAGEMSGTLTPVRTEDRFHTKEVRCQLRYQGNVLATPTGFEPVISCVTGRRIWPAMLRCRLEMVHPDGIEPPTRCL